MRRCLLIVAALFLPAPFHTSASGQCIPSLGDFQVSAAGDGPRAVVAADFNQDGAPDLVVANANTNTISVHLGIGAGQFQPRVNYAVGTTPRALAAADFNGDGRLDLAVANNSSANVWIFFGLPNGSFTHSSIAPVGTAPTGVASGDFNADGLPDLAVCSAGLHTVVVLLNNGAGAFPTSQNYGVGTGPSGIVASDLDGDGVLELITSNANASSVSVLRGLPGGGFQPASSYPTGANSGPAAVAVGDFNADGRGDVATANETQSSVAVLLGTGIAQLLPAVQYPTVSSSGPRAIAAADLTLDGRDDLIVGLFNYSHLAVFHSNPDGTFAAPNFYFTGSTSGPQAVAIADFHQGGVPDVAAGLNSADSVGVFRTIIPGPILFVNAAAGTGGDGSSWANAMPRLKDALELASTLPCISQIWVASGTYTPAPTGGSRSASFQLRNGLAIYGGFSGTETQLSQRNIAANPTVLSGDLNGDDNGDLNRGDNSYHVINGTGVGGSSVLDGFTITAGNANSSFPNDQGGGVFLRPGSPVIRHCTLLSNSATAAGALYVAQTSCPQFADCSFIANKATAGVGGAAVLANDCSASFVRTVFRDNTAATSGGAIEVGGAPSTPSVVFVRCEFLRNRCEQGGGGACYVHDAPSLTTFVLCSFRGNRSGASNGSAVWCDNGATSRLHGCDIVGNEAGATGAWALVCDHGASLSLLNCVIASNRSALSGQGAGGIFMNSNTAQIVMTNSIVVGNRSPSGSVEQQQFRLGPTAGSLQIDRSIIEGWTGSLGGTGNNGLDPLFRRIPSPGLDTVWGTPDDDYGDLRLTNGSPAIDTGDSTDVPPDTYDIDGDGNTTESLPLDLDGAARFFDAPAVANTGIGTPPVDRGVYEFVPPVITEPGIRRWVSPTGGTFNSPFDWFPAAPGPFDSASFDIQSTYTIDFTPATTVSNQRAVIARGHPTLDLNGSTYRLTSSILPSLIVGDTDPTPTSFTVTQGTLAPFAALIGSTTGTDGTLRISGPGARLNITQGDLAVGFFGRGEFILEGGATALTRTASVGDQPGSAGSSVLVTGPGSRWTVPFFLSIASGTVQVRSGGVLDCGFGIFLLQDGTITGDGTINGPVINFGSIEPGNSPGTLRINGSFTQVGEIPGFGSSAGRLKMQVEGTGTNQFDRLVVTGQTQLGGGLIVESPVGGFPAPPPEGLSLPLIDALGGIGISDTTGMPADHFDVAFFPRVPGPGGGPSDQFLRLERPEGGGAQFFNLTTGTLGAPLNVNDPSNTSATSTPSSVTAGDLDGDGLSDLVLTTPSNDSAVILMNRGSMGGEWQGFEGAVQFAVGTNPQGATIFDIDADGIPDLSIVNQGSNSVSLFRNTTIPGSHAVALSGQGSLTTGLGPTGIIAKAFDGSGTRPVIVTTDEAAGVISILIRTGSPGFNFTPRTSKPIPVATPPRAPRELDIDGDGAHPDLALLSVGGSAVVILQNISMGTGIVAFADPVVLPVGDSPSQLEVAMLRDGRPSLVTANTGGDSMSVLVNTSDMSNPTRFAPAVNIPAGSGPLSLAALDVDNDTDADIAILTDTGQGANPLKVRLFRNDFIVAGLQQNDQVTFVNDRDLPDEGAPTNALFVLAANLASPMVTDLLTINSQGGGRGPGEMALNVRPRLNATMGGVVNPCFVDFNMDGFVEPGDLDEFITSYFSDTEEERNRCD
ncbi:MAG: FG-GAP-like repeat-containing protein, partial [Phycisphaerales bacterium]